MDDHRDRKKRFPQGGTLPASSFRLGQTHQVVVSQADNQMIFWIKSNALKIIMNYMNYIFPFQAKEKELEVLNSILGQPSKSALLSMKSQHPDILEHLNNIHLASSTQRSVAI